MNPTRKTTILITLALVGLLALGVATIYAQGPDDDTPPCDWGEFWGHGMTQGHGHSPMMGGRGPGMMNNMPDECFEQRFFDMHMMMDHMGMGPDMHGMMPSNFEDFDQFGPGSGMMGAWQAPSDLVPEDKMTLNNAVSIADAYIAAWEIDRSLTLGEVMQFTNHFYGMAVEVETGRAAFEFIIDSTGYVIGEPGPNMMWNLRYGMQQHMVGGFSGTAEAGVEMTVPVEEAQQAAQTYLDEALPGAAVSDEADAFYGYYTFHILQDGEIIGMLSVNGYNSQVWLHRWHGDFVDMTEHSE